jgi:hypothetical protein
MSIQAWPGSFERLLLRRPAVEKPRPLGEELERIYRRVLREMLPLTREASGRRIRNRAA